MLELLAEGGVRAQGETDRRGVRDRGDENFLN